MHDRSTVGNKAFNLGRLFAAGYRVPPGFCIPATAFQAAVEGLAAQGLAAQDPAAKGADTGGSGSDGLLAAPLDGELVAELGRVWETLAADGPSGGAALELAVRSSAACEDGAARSLAGQYHTELGVRTFPDLLVAVRKCWASALSPLVLRGSGDARGGDPDACLILAVIVQREVRPDRAGVLFTRDPVSDRDETLVEASFGHGQNIVSGAGKSNLYRLARDGEVLEAPRLQVEVLDGAQLAELHRTGLELERLFGGPQDVEWAYENGLLYLLQTRPVTTGQEQTLPFLIDMDDLEQGRRHPLGGIQDFFDVWAAKKVWIRRHARALGYDMSRGFLTGWEGAPPEDLAKTLDSRLRGEVFEVIAPAGRQLFHRNGLGRILDEAAEAARGNGPMIIALRERLPAELSGLATFLPDGGVLAEYVRGAHIALNYGEVEPSRCILNTAGHVVRRDLVEAPVYYDLDLEHLAWVARPLTAPPPELDGKLLRGILKMLAHMRQRFGEVRLEWYVHQGQLFFGDLAFERGTMPETAAAGGDSPGTRVIAPGPLAGWVFQISDLSPFEELLGRHDFSVHRQAGFADAFREEALQPLFVELGQQPRPLLLVAEYPHPALSLLVGRVDGFIFERAPVLSHLAIILREEGVPARAVPGALQRFTDGQWVELAAG